MLDIAFQVVVEERMSHGVAVSNSLLAQELQGQICAFKHDNNVKNCKCVMENEEIN